MVSFKLHQSRTLSLFSNLLLNWYKVCQLLWSWLQNSHVCLRNYRNKSPGQTDRRTDRRGRRMPLTRKTMGSSRLPATCLAFFPSSLKKPFQHPASYDEALKTQPSHLLRMPDNKTDSLPSQTFVYWACDWWAARCRSRDTPSNVVLRNN